MDSHNSVYDQVYEVQIDPPKAGAKLDQNEELSNKNKPSNKGLNEQNNCSSAKKNNEIIASNITITINKNPSCNNQNAASNPAGRNEGNNCPNLQSQNNFAQ